MASWGIALRSFSEVGPVAQLVARFIDIEKVIGSSPIGPTHAWFFHVIARSVYSSRRGNLHK